MTAFSKRLLAVTALFLALLSPALAHPHIWVDATAIASFDANGDLASIHHVWQFDAEFSAWSVQGLDTNNDGQVTSAEMQELADQSTGGLSEFDYYTFAGIGDKDIKFTPAHGGKMSYDGSRVTLEFDIAPQIPVSITGPFEIEVNDPEYYVAFTYAGPNAVTLVGAPTGCVSEAHGPGELDPALAERLYAIGPEVHDLPPDLKDAMRDVTNLATITCPPPLPHTANTAPAPAAAAPTVASGPAFAAPAPEPALPMPSTGFLGWVNAQQKAFYAALTAAIASIKTDGHAFLGLGVLSFLYGVFHAAGPGHGKVIMTSYLLASRADLQRGILLSFAAAMLQSLVAISFVLIAAVALDLTAIAMSRATSVLTSGAYALVVLLGLWLLARKLMSLRKGAAHHHDHHHGHDHEHGQDHGHNHAVTPAHLRGGWREQLGVVVSIGLRPCSGALIVLVFALSQGLLLAGIAATLLMGLGTALSITALAATTVLLKGAAVRISNPRLARVTASVIWWLELFGACAILALGVILFMSNI